MSAPNTAHSRTTGVRRNLFHQHLSRRPTVTSTSAPTNSSLEHNSAEIVVRDKNGDLHLDDALLLRLDDNDIPHDETHEDDHDRQQRLKDAIRHHQRDKNRTPSEPAELLEAVRANLKAKMVALAEDNWRYEAEDKMA